MPAWRRPTSTALALAALFLLALVLRSLFLYLVFQPDGSVVMRPADASYHARRAFYSFLHFPAVLWFDSYLNFPDGSPVPWPPGYDFLLAGVARAFGTTTGVFERTAAWVAPVLGALTILPVYEIGLRLGGRGLGLGAAALFAVLPASVLTSSVGDPDHHAAVALLGATLLLASLALVSRDDAGRRWRGWGAVWTLTMIAMLLTWNGSLLYLGLAHGLVGLVGVIQGRSGLLALQAGCALGAALGVAPVVAAAPVLGGPLSSVNLSWLHVLALASVAVVAGGAALLEGWRPGATAPGRSLRATLLAAGCLGVALAVPALRAVFDPVTRLFAKQDDWADRVVEGRSILADPEAIDGSYGAFLFLLPLCLLAAAWRSREPRLREPMRVFTVWTAVLAGLALYYVRFAADFGPAAAVLFALGLQDAQRALVRRWPSRELAFGAAAMIAGLLLLAPAAPTYARLASRTLESLRGGEVDTSAHLGLLALDRFARSLRELTPETAGFADDAPPEYGLLARPAHGHVLKWLARRPVSADPFGPYLDAGRLERVRRFFETQDSEEASAIAAGLRARYAVTSAYYDAASPKSVAGRLQRTDGRPSPGQPPVRGFRLVAEGPDLGPDAPRLPGGAAFKLFEEVPGAVLELHAEPGATVRARLRLRSSLGRVLVWSESRRAGPDGRVELRVPYASEASLPVAAEGPWRVRVGDRELAVEVSHADVREGRRIRVGAPPLSPPPRDPSPPPAGSRAP